MKISEILKSKGHAVATIDPEVCLGVAVKTMATKSVGASSCPTTAARSTAS